MTSREDLAKQIKQDISDKILRSEIVVEGDITVSSFGRPRLSGASISFLGDSSNFTIEIDYCGNTTLHDTLVEYLLGGSQ